MRRRLPGHSFPGGPLADDEHVAPGGAGAHAERGDTTRLTALPDPLSESRHVTNPRHTRQWFTRKRVHEEALTPPAPGSHHAVHRHQVPGLT